MPQGAIGQAFSNGPLPLAEFDSTKNIDMPVTSEKGESASPSAPVTRPALPAISYEEAKSPDPIPVTTNTSVNDNFILIGMRRATVPTPGASIKVQQNGNSTNSDLYRESSLNRHRHRH